MIQKSQGAKSAATAADAEKRKAQYRTNGQHAAFAGRSGSQNCPWPTAPHRVIYLKERNLNMLKNDLILRNPLRLMQSDETEDTLEKGGFGAVLARAGVGKTALLVQLSLNSMLKGQNVLHISLADPVYKVGLWYEEVFSHIARQYAIKQANDLWETLLPHRFIMTFQVEGFSAAKLEERLTDLTTQNIFSPHMVLIDGLPFDASVRTALEDLKALAGKFGCHIWFTVRTHRHESTNPNDMLQQLASVADLFEVVIQLQPEGKDIYVNALKGRRAASGESALLLDPATMLITDRKWDADSDR